MMKKELLQHLSDEYMACMKKEEELVTRKCLLESEQKKLEENLNFHKEDETKRQLFSPLPLGNGKDKHDVLTQEFQKNENDKQLKQCADDLSQIEEEKQQLKTFIHGISQELEKEERQEEEQRGSFREKFEKILSYTKKSFSGFKLEVSQNKDESDCKMPETFIYTWLDLLAYIEEELPVEGLKIQLHYEKKRVALELRFQLKQALQEEKREALKQQLSEYMRFHSRGKNLFEISMIIK